MNLDMNIVSLEAFLNFNMILSIFKMWRQCELQSYDTSATVLKFCLVIDLKGIPVQLL